MPEEVTCPGAARHHHRLDGLEVLLGLFLGPTGRALGQALQAERRAAAVAGDASRVPFALLEEERWDPGLVELVIKSLARRGRRRLLSKQCRKKEFQHRNLHPVLRPTGFSTDTNGIFD